MFTAIYPVGTIRSCFSDKTNKMYFINSFPLFRDHQTNLSLLICNCDFNLATFVSCLFVLDYIEEGIVSNLLNYFTKFYEF